MEKLVHISPKMLDKSFSKSSAASIVCIVSLKLALSMGERKATPCAQITICLKYSNNAHESYILKVGEIKAVSFTGCGR